MHNNVYICISGLLLHFTTLHLLLLHLNDIPQKELRCVYTLYMLRFYLLVSTLCTSMLNVVCTSDPT